MEVLPTRKSICQNTNICLVHLYFPFEVYTHPVDTIGLGRDNLSTESSVCVPHLCFRAGIVGTLVVQYKHE